MKIIVITLVAIIATTTLGFLLQLIRAWIDKIIYLYEKKHAKKEDLWMYK